jgi:hypothetical protein
MKSHPRLLILLCSLLVLSCHPALAQQTAAFLTVGKHYAVTGLLSADEVSSAGLPRTVTIVSKGPDQWYLIQTADGRDVRSWINFGGVLSFSAMPEGFEPSNKPRKIAP